MKYEGEKSKATVLQEHYDRWHDLYLNGGTSPFYTDGESLNFIRRVIVNLKTMTKDDSNHPSAYFAETPPEVDKNLMVNKEYIRIQAKAVLDKIECDTNLAYLQDNHVRLTEKEAKSDFCKYSLRYALTYVGRLAAAIRNGDYLEMRMLGRCEKDATESMASVRASLDEILCERQQQPETSVQLSFYL